MTRKSILTVSVVAAAVVALVLAIIMTRGDKTVPGSDIVAERSNVFGHPALSSAQPVPTGRPAAGAEEFRRDPCAVATVDELGVALAQPFHLVTGTFPRRDRPPSATGAGCTYSFLADGSDPAEVFHRMLVTVSQATDGANVLSQCLAAGPKIPYGPVDAGDQACLSAGSSLVIRLGANHYTINVAATPPRADRKDEDHELAPLVRAAAKIFAARLPNR